MQYVDGPLLHFLQLVLFSRSSANIHRSRNKCREEAAEKARKPITCIWWYIIRYVLSWVEPSHQRTCHVVIYSSKYPSISAEHGWLELDRCRVIFIAILMPFLHGRFVVCTAGQIRGWISSAVALSADAAAS